MMTSNGQLDEKKSAYGQITESSLEFPTDQAFGRVIRVDTTKVLVDASDHDLVAPIQVGGLIAIQGKLSTEYLIASIEGVARDVVPNAELAIDERNLREGKKSEEDEYGEFRKDLVRVIFGRNLLHKTGCEKECLRARN